MYRIICIIKIFYYEKKTKLPVIKYEDEIWVKAKTVANILRYKNTMKSIRDHVDPEDKKRLLELGPNLNRTKRSPWKIHPWKETRKRDLYKRVRIIQSNTSL